MHLPKMRRKLIVLLVAIVLVVGSISTTAAAKADSVLDGITVGGIAVAGSDRSQLTATLTAPAKAQDKREMTLVVGDRKWKRTPASMGITVDLEATVDQAMAAGRENPFAWLMHEFGSGTRALAWVPRIDRTRFDQAMAQLKVLVELAPANGEIVLSGAQVDVKPPTEGVKLLVAETRRALIKTAVLSNRSVALPVTLTPPSIGSAQLEQVEQQARGILAAPVLFTFAGSEISLPPDKLATALRTRVETTDSIDSLVLDLDPAELTRQIVAVHPPAEKPAQDASFTVRGDKVVTNPSADGTTIDAAGAAPEILRLRGTDRFPIALQSIVKTPAFTTEAAQALQIKQKIASYSTTFDAGNAPRVRNIDLMAKAIDGKILRPDEATSLNGITGPRTPETGYQEAKVIVDGELVPGLGGGVCQVATTVFNAAFNAGIDIVERTNHSLYISHYPTGRDATVNYGHQDLKFRNDTPYGILLKATVNSRSLTVSLYSSPLDRVVESTVGPRTNPSTQTNKYVDDPTLPAGQEVVQEEGSPGFNIVVTRTVKQGDVVLHSDTFVSKYRAWKRIIRRGTGPASPAPSPSS